MSSNYAQSKNIIIFPCVSRTYKGTTTNPEVNTKAKLMSEENITNIIKSITDRKSYLISRSGNKFIFVLDGYYIELNIELNEALTGTQYVKLSYNKSGNHLILHGDDPEGVFLGLEISTTKPTSGEYLCLLYNGETPTESYYKFDTKSMKFDFGELN